MWKAGMECIHTSLRALLVFLYCWTWFYYFIDSFFVCSGMKLQRVKGVRCMVRTDNYAMNPHPIAISAQIKILYEPCLEEVLKKYKKESVCFQLWILHRHPRLGRMKGLGWAGERLGGGRLDSLRVKSSELDLTAAYLCCKISTNVVKLSKFSLILLLNLFYNFQWSKKLCVTHDY